MVIPELARPSAVARPGAGRVADRAALARWAPAAVVLALTVTGVVIRLIVAHQSLFADELSTYWIVVGHTFGQVVALLAGSATIGHEVIRHAEITPPLYFVLAWVFTQLGHGNELLRVPSLIAGALTIPLVYRLGLRTVGRAAALIGCALTALSPFMIYYSTEARAYAVMMVLVVISTLALLLGVEQRRTRWWVIYGAASCLALYSHYTCAFVLAAQLVWLLWAHPEARRPAIIANLAAAAGLLPWIPGLINDFTSPTLKILYALSPFTLHDIPRILGHWAIGYPYTNGRAGAFGAGLAKLPGPVALVLLGLSVLVGVAGRPWRGLRPRLLREHSGLVLVIAMALATPVGEAVVSAFGSHIFGVRNLAASSPALALAFAALVIRGNRPVGAVAAALAVAGFAIGAGLMLSAPFARPNYAAAGAFATRSGDVVIDETGELSPGPTTPLDTTFSAPGRIFRAGSPAERTHPYGFADPIVPVSAAIRQAVARAKGGPVLLISTLIPPGAQVAQRREPANPAFPAPYRLVARHVYPGIMATEVRVYAAG